MFHGLAFSWGRGFCMQVLFGNAEMRWVDAYFPFTTPSFELEVMYQGKWLEVLGSGMIQQQILTNAGREAFRGWVSFRLSLCHHNYPIHLFTHTPSFSNARS